MLIETCDLWLRYSSHYTLFNSFILIDSKYVKTLTTS